MFASPWNSNVDILTYNGMILRSEALGPEGKALINGISTLIKGAPVEKEMATHSSILAWKISWTEETGGPQSMGSQRVTRLRTYPCKSESHSVVSNSLRPHELHSSWNSPGQNTGVGSLSLLQGIFPTQGSNPGLPCCRWILYQLSHKGSPSTDPLWGRDPRKLSSPLSAIRTERGVHLLGEAHWLTLPTLARHHSNHLHELSW